MKRTASGRPVIPFLAAMVMVSASLGQTIQLDTDPSSPSHPSSLHSSLPPSSPYSPPRSLSGIGPTEGELRAALPGRALRRVDIAEFQRMVAFHGAEGRLLSGPALSAALAQGPASQTAPSQSASAPSSPSQPASASSASAQSGSPVCRHADSLRQRACLDSLSRARAQVQSRGEESPRALREIERENARDTVYVGPDGEEVERPRLRSDEADAAEEVQEARNRGYFTQFFFDMSRGDWDWDGGDWAAVIYVVVGVIVVGAFILFGVKALYDLVVNKDDAPVFKEVGLRFSYSGLTMYDNKGSSLYRDAYLVGLRFAIGVERDVLALGLAVEGGSINLTVHGVNPPSETLDYRGGYLVGGPMVRFGNYHPLALSLEFLNGTSDHRDIGWISKTRMALQAKTGAGLLTGAHLGAVFYDLRYSDGLVFRRGDLNSDLSLVFGVDVGWSF